jgi:hypothetical protein
MTRRTASPATGEQRAAQLLTHGRLCAPAHSGPACWHRRGVCSSDLPCSAPALHSPLAICSAAHLAILSAFKSMYAAATKGNLAAFQLVRCACACSCSCTCASCLRGVRIEHSTTTACTRLCGSGSVFSPAQLAGTPDTVAPCLSVVPPLQGRSKLVSSVVVPYIQVRGSARLLGYKQS